MTKTTKQKIFEKLNSWCYKLLTFLRLEERKIIAMMSSHLSSETKIQKILLFYYLQILMAIPTPTRMTGGSSSMEFMSDGNEDQLIKNLN